MPDDAMIDKDTLMMQTLYWWGVPTLFRCPHEPDPARCDIALVGVPHSTGNGSTERDQHLGPRAVRDVSASGRRPHGRYMLDPWKTVRIADLGDVPFPEANNNERCIERINAFYRRIDEAGAFPVSVGGDHSITGGILEAIAGPGAKTTKGEKAVLVHFDAHTDVYEKIDHFLGAKKSAAHWASYLARNGHVDPTHSLQIGIRGHVRTLDWLRPSYDLGYEVITMDRYEEIGHDACVKLIHERVGDRPIYITFDLDCLDPTVAPGVANIEPAFTGFTMSQAVRLIQSLQGFNIIGGDVACLMPTKDNPNKITALVASSIMFEILCLIADRLRKEGKGRTQ